MPLQPLKLLTDQAIGENTDGRKDGLGFTEYARTLAGAALGTEGPFTIGIFGDWGTGKTSLMRMMKKELDEIAAEERLLTVWFEAWRYGREDHPIIPLVATIIREIERYSIENSSDEEKYSLFDDIKSALGAFIYGTKLKVNIAPVEIEMSPEKMSERLDEIIKNRQKATEYAVEESLYFNAFDSLSQMQLGSERGKIVLFIDDLDRCLPDVAVQLLETIKLVLSQVGFIFVMGMSRPVIDGFLNYRFEKEFGLINFSGRDYLDKIAQFTFYIPPHSNRINGFVRSIVSVLNEQDQLELSDILPITGLACKNNPRAIVRYINNLLIDKSIQSQIPIRYFAITRSLQQFWPELFLILASEENSKLCKDVHNWLQNEIPAVNNDSESLIDQVADYLRGDNDLKLLLSTQQGLDWLINKQQRKSAIQFLQIDLDILESLDSLHKYFESFQLKFAETNLENIDKAIKAYNTYNLTKKFAEIYLKNRKRNSDATTRTGGNLCADSV